MRNSTVTTIAPTGTISIIADASSGIEPIFALAFQHKVDDRKLTFLNPSFATAAKEKGIDSEELMDRVAAQGTVHGIDGVPDEMQRVFVTAHEGAPQWHVRNAGRLPEVHRQRRVKDHQSPQRSHHRRCRERLRSRLEPSAAWASRCSAMAAKAPRS